MLLIPPPSAIAHFQAVVADLLPLALPEMQKFGCMTTCAYCGKPLDGAAITCVVVTISNTYFHLNIMALCKVDAASPPEISPCAWAHISETSGLYPEVYQWDEFLQALSSFAGTTLRKKSGQRP